MSDDNALKYVYLKYTFIPEDRCDISTIYFDRGAENRFLVNNDFILLRSPQGGLINSFQFKIENDTLILKEPSTDGVAESDLLKYYFVREDVFQNAIPLQPSDIYSIKTGDTIYKESAKVCAMYNNEGFQGYIYKGISDKISMDNRVGHLVASFVVSKSGVADSVKILEGVDDSFNKQFLKVFNKAKKDWKPALLGGKAVAVRMMVELTYSTSATAIPAQMANEYANRAYNHKQYDIAIYYYDKVLANTPRDQYSLFRRGMCKMILGNKAAACEDWNKAIEVGGNMEIEALLQKYCK